MPITAITIENFKGIADSITIPIRPITLLFGKNSAGKSTILQALHYLYEVLEHHRPDPDRTQLGGDAIDLGGFQSLVHRNELDRRIRVRVAFSLDDDGILPTNGIIAPGTGLEEFRLLAIDLNSVVPLESAWIEAITAWEDNRGAYIAEYAIGLNGEELIRLRQPYGLRPELLHLNFGHAVMQELDRQDAQESDDSQQFSERLWSIFEDQAVSEIPKVFSKPIPLNAQNCIIPASDQPFLVDDSFTDSLSDPEIQFRFWSMVGQALTGPLTVLLQELRGIRYLGPIREVPPRSYRAPKTPLESRWAGGLGAWDALVRDPTLVEKTSDSLQDVLCLGYSMRHEQRITLDAEGVIVAALRLLATQYEEKDAAYVQTMILDPLERLPRHAVIQLHDEVNDIDVAPADIGVGVSQVIPVVVGALDAGSAENPCRIFAVEQPELHVHPAVQVTLGDVFINAISGTERIMLIETHSEHLLLRLLRRVRESADGTLESPAPTLTPDELSIVHVKPKEKGVEITPLPITEEGEFTRHWPDGFFEERAEELF